MILGAVRADREAAGAKDMSRQAFADELDCTWAAVDRFEQGLSASAEMLLAYPRLLGMTMDEMDELADKMAGNVSALMFDRRLDPIERAMIADRLVRAESDGFSKKIREAVDGPCGTRTHAPPPRERPPSPTVLDGSPNPKRSASYQTRLPV